MRKNKIVTVSLPIELIQRAQAHRTKTNVPLSKTIMVALDKQLTSEGYKKKEGGKLK